MDLSDEVAEAWNAIHEWALLSDSFTGVGAKNLPCSSRESFAQGFIPKCPESGLQEFFLRTEQSIYEVRGVEEQRKGTHKEGSIFPSLRESWNLGRAS